MEIHKYGGISAVPDPGFVWSGRFEVERSSLKYFDSRGMLTFPDRGKSGEYHTVFGPSFVHNGEHFIPDNVGLSVALTRLTAARNTTEFVNGIPMHEHLKNQQKINFTCEYMRPWIAHVQSGVYSSSELAEILREGWTEKVHPKRLLRQHVEEEYYHTMPYHESHAYAVEYKVKKGETLKNNGKLRGIADLGPHACAISGYYVDIVKDAMEKPYYYKGCEILYVSCPKNELLKEVFRKLFSPSGKMFFVLFSDDSCLAVRTTTDVFWADMDISSCDGSQYTPVFNVLKESMAHPLYNKDIDKTFKQLKSKLRLRSVGSKPSCTATIKLSDPDDIPLLSGSTLTVITNNTSNVGIAMRIADKLDELPDFNRVEGIVLESASEMGYIVKCKPVANFEELTFLKHSSTLDFELFLGLGVLLRSFGTFCGDLPGRGSIEERARAFNSDVVKSFVHAGDHIITRAFNSHKILSTLKSNKNRNYAERILEKGYSTDAITTTSLCKRYGCGEQELVELARSIEQAKVGHVINLPVVDVIMRMDYGYPMH